MHFSLEFKLRYDSDSFNVQTVSAATTLPITKAEISSDIIRIVPQTSWNWLYCFVLFPNFRYSHVSSLACWYGLRVLLCIICTASKRGIQTWCPVVLEKSQWPWLSSSPGGELFLWSLIKRNTTLLCPYCADKKILLYSYCQVWKKPDKVLICHIMLKISFQGNWLNISAIGFNNKTRQRWMTYHK